MNRVLSDQMRRNHVTGDDHYCRRRLVRKRIQRIGLAQTDNALIGVNFYYNRFGIIAGTVYFG